LIGPIWPLRAMLFIPATKPDWVRKVGRYAPDAVVLDLEDAVPPAEKVAARASARDAIEMLREMNVPAFVRINPFEEGGAEDVAAVARPGLTGIFLPKVRSAKDIAELDIQLSFAEGCNGLALRSLVIVPIPETAEGMRGVHKIVRASPRVVGAVGLVSGPVAGDFARAAGIRPTEAGLEQMYFASKTVIDCRAAGAMYPLAALMGTRLDDLAAVRALAERARDFGFSGATVIYPSHLAVVQDVFSPSAAEIEDARSLLAAMQEGEARGDGAVNHRGRMVDYAMLARARQILRDAERYGLLSGKQA
jgi:citrate lyase subunit beta/citryl-CoA lyase